MNQRQLNEKKVRTRFDLEVNFISFFSFVNSSKSSDQSETDNWAVDVLAVSLGFLFNDEKMVWRNNFEAFELGEYRVRCL